MYAKYFKRILDFCLSLMALIALGPVLLILTAVGAYKMKGNPFFTQPRPGKDEKVFKLIKFRSMTCEKDASGKLLPDEQRLTRYGMMLRNSSLDELPELINILKGDMSIVGPRPIIPEEVELIYLRKLHGAEAVRPGLTGWAQINGRDNLKAPKKSLMDGYYARHASWKMDIGILFKTVKYVLSSEDVVEGHTDTNRPTSAQFILNTRAYI